MQRKRDQDLELQRAEATIVVLRQLVTSPHGSLLDRYLLSANVTSVDRAEARRWLAKVQKPIVCVSTVEDQALRIDCKDIEGFFSIPEGSARNWEVARQILDERTKARLRALSPAPVESWTAVITGSDSTVRLGFAEYLRWMTEYSFRKCVTDEEPRIDNEVAPYLLLRFRASQGESETISFVSLNPQRSR